MYKTLFLIAISCLLFLTMYHIDFSVRIDKDIGLEILMFAPSYVCFIKSKTYPSIIRNPFFRLTLGLCFFINLNLLYYKLCGSLFNKGFLFVFFFTLVHRVIKDIILKGRGIKNF